mgnify:CR=1 FL=1
MWEWDDGLKVLNNNGNISDVIKRPSGVTPHYPHQAGGHQTVGSLLVAGVTQPPFDRRKRY